jgi:hypothetical protein
VKKIISILFALSFVFTACTITQEYHFKKDFSGNAKTSIDLAMFKSFMNNLDSTGSGNNSLDTLDQSMAEAARQLEAMGVENVQFGWNEDKTILYLSYDFKDIETLNKAMSSEQTGTKLFNSSIASDSKARFEAKGKKFFYDSPEILENDTLFNSEGMSSMKDYYKYNMIFTFEREIKSFDNKKATLSDDKKSVVFSGSIADMFAKGSSFDINIKLKKK